MLLEEASFKIPEKLQVRQIVASYDDTYVILYQVSSYQLEKNLYHLKGSGDIIKKYQFKDVVKSFSMLNDHKVAVFMIKEQTILVIDLKNQTHRGVLITLTGKQAQLLNFYESSLLCIVQKFQEEDSWSCKCQLKLTYMENCLTKGSMLKVDVDVSNKDASARYFSTQVVKVNHNSMVGIFKVGSQQKYEVTLHFIHTEKGQAKSVIRVITFPLQGSMLYTFPIWQIKKDEVAIIHKNIDKQKFIGVINIWDNTYRPFECSLKSPEDKIRAVFLKNYIFIRQGNYYSPQYNCSPGKKYFINSETEKLEFGEQQENAMEKSDGIWISDTSVLVENTFDRENGSLIVRKWRPAGRNEVCLHFLLFLNDEFDDDLLLDALKLLDCA